MRTRSITVSHTRRRVIGAALAVVVLAAPALATPGSEAADAQVVSVTVEQPRPTVDPSGALDFTVSTQVTTDTPYLETRLQVFNPGGSLLYQKTEVRHDVPAGSIPIRFTRDVADLDLAEGRYPATVRVLATGSEATFVEDRMLVVADDREPLTVAVVVRVTCAPSRDPEGRFVIDPEASAPQRDEILDALALARPGRPLAAALPPIMLEDWLRAAGGYETAGPEGVVEVAETDPVPMSYAAALERLGDIVDDGDIELLDVPYAEPDLQGLQAMVAIEDLAEHYRAGRTIYQISIAATPTVGTAISGDSISAQALGVLDEREIGYVLLDPATATDDTTPTGGAHRIEGSDVTAVIVEPEAGRAVESGDTAALVDALFGDVLAETGAPIVLQTTLGPGADGSLEALADSLEALDAVDWIRLVTLPEIAAEPDSVELTLAEQVDQGAQPPLGYWGEVLESRRQTVALRDAAGDRDPDAERAMTGVLTAESRCWAGPDDGWGLADRGRAYAAEAGRRAGSILAAVTISSEDITLAGRTGKVPLSIVNGSSKELTVTVTAGGQSARIGPPDTLEIGLRPAENFLTLPVSMSSALSDRLKVDVLAGDTIIATTEVRIRASYLDRLTIAGSVVLVLAGLLLYIRRRVMT